MEDLQVDQLRSPPLDKQLATLEQGDNSLSNNKHPTAMDSSQTTSSDYAFSEDNYVLPSPTISELAKDFDATLIYKSHGTEEITAFEYAPKIFVEKRKHNWNSALQQLCKQNKDSHWQWKIHGCPSYNDNLINKKRLVLKRELRQLQRQLNAEERHSLYENSMSAHCGDNATFHKIIRRQRQSGKRRMDYLIVGDYHYDTPDLICEAWTDKLF
ncbi:unnamed protein product [Mytilus coruscus]|uniref:Uncharacterized protein n=1 Tax=Mytilus coruscus TaxID=42192 RepID=A0A6J8DJ14_MYTCO|nr:unnamed protein product [Mytilus coruscus]